MEPFKQLSDLLPVLIFLLPGFVSGGIVEMLVVRKPKDTFGKCLEAFIFTTINLVAFVLLRGLLEWSFPVKFNRHEFFTAGNLGLMSLCAVAIGLLWAYEGTNEPVFEWLRRRGITRKTTKVSTWNETLVANQKFVIVHLKGDRRVYGWPKFYSDDPAERAIFLEDASWLSDKSELLNNPPINIFLDKESGIELIEFLDHGYEPAKTPTESAGQATLDRAQRPATEAAAESAARTPAALPDGDVARLPPLNLTEPHHEPREQPRS